jgi:hypothetical protein
MQIYVPSKQQLCLFMEWNKDKKIKTLNRAYTFSQHGLSQAYKLKKKKNK